MQPSTSSKSKRTLFLSSWNPFAALKGAIARWHRAYVDDARNLLLLDKQLQNCVRQLSRFASATVYDTKSPSTLSPAVAKEAEAAWARFIDLVLSIQETANWHRLWIVRFRFLNTPCHVRAFLLCDVADLAIYEAGLRLTANLAKRPVLCRFLNDEHRMHYIERGSYDIFYEKIHNPERPVRQYAARQYLKLLKHRKRSWQRAQKDSITKQLAERTDNLHPKLKSRVRKAIATYANRTIKVRSKKTMQQSWFPVQKNLASTMGLIKIKRRGLFLITPEQTRQIKKKLQPGDIGLTRRNWFLSNVGIPGFWPHALIHIGTPAEVRLFFSTPEVLVWVKEEEPEADSFIDLLRIRYPKAWKTWNETLTPKQAVEKGITVGKLAKKAKIRPAFIEAVRPGVVIRPPEEALFADHSCFLRPRLPRVELAKAIERAFSHFGKPYDYNFDFATSAQLVCSELVFKSYQPDEGFTGLNFILEETLGRPILPPNKIPQTYAEQYDQPDRCFDFVCFMDASEKTGRCKFKPENEFRDTWKRSKWSLNIE